MFPTAFIFKGSELQDGYIGFMLLCGDAGNDPWNAGCQYIWDNDHTSFTAACEGAGGTSEDCEAFWGQQRAFIDLICPGLNDYGKTVPGPWASILNSDVTLDWVPLLVDDDDWIPQYTATFTTTIDGNEETLTYSYKCTEFGCFQLDITATAGYGGSTWTTHDGVCGTNLLNLQGLDTTDPCYCIGVDLIAVDPQNLELPDPYPDTLYLHWGSTTLGDGVVIEGTTYQMCPPDDLTNPIPFHKVTPKVPFWVSDCVEVCMTKDDANQPPLIDEDHDVPREPAPCYGVFTFGCTTSDATTDNTGGWVLTGAGRGSNDLYGSDLATVTTVVSCDPIEIHLNQFEIGSSVGFVGSVFSDCHLESEGYSGVCGLFHGGDSIFFIIHDIVITEV